MNWKSILSTDNKNWAALFIRLTIGIVIFAHGSQKLLGWFGGYGFSGTMGYMTGAESLPWIIGLLVILNEFFGSLALVTGFFTRIAAVGMIIEFFVIIVKVHFAFGFFMNWGAVPNKGEGFEYHILIIGLAIAALIAGGGKWSIDSIMAKKKVEAHA